MLSDLHPFQSLSGICGVRTKPVHSGRRLVKTPLSHTRCTDRGHWDRLFHSLWSLGLEAASYPLFL